MKILTVILLFALTRCYADGTSDTNTNLTSSKEAKEFLSVSNAALFFTIMESNTVNDVKKIIVSPDKTVKVIVFQRNCGALCSFNRQIVVIKNSDGLPKRDFPGNFFYAENRSSSKIDLLPKIQVTWLSTNELHIKYPNVLEVTTNLPNQPIKVTYERFTAK